MQGPSISNEIAKRMLLQVLSAVDSKGLDPLFFSSDGQWIKFIVKDFDEKPLTKIQKQKQFWEKVKKMPKDKLVQFFSTLTVKGSQQSQSSENETSFDSVHLKQRHLALMSEKKPKVAKNLSSSEDTAVDTDCDAKVFDLLPSNLLEKVDPDTYNEIVQTIKSLVPNENMETAENEEQIPEVEHDPNIPSQEPSKPLHLDQQHMEIIMSALRSEDDTRNESRWSCATLEELKQICSSGESIQNGMKLHEIKIVMKTMKQLFPAKTKNIRLSSPKWKLVCDLTFLLGIRPAEATTRRHKDVQSLRDQSLRIVKKIPKVLLCAIYAEITFPEEEEKWLRSFPFTRCTMVNGNTPVTWYSFPAVRHRDHPPETIPLIGIVDSHHILTNIRCKCCSSGIVSRGIKTDAWLKVAKNAKVNKAGLTVAHVQDIIDKQNNAFAQLTFSEEVENVMRENGDMEEAQFCQKLRNWYQADDEPGLPPETRLNNRLQLREWLLCGYNSHTFPPPTGYVRGIPIITFEALMTNIERRIQAYAFVDGQAYNQRSLTTLDVENFFSVLGDYSPCASKLAIRPADIPAAMKTACEISLLQMDQSKSFHMHTSRAPVYPKIHLMEANVHDENEEENNARAQAYKSDMSSIHMRHHEFDSQHRRRRSGKRKSALLSGPSCASKGALGVRQHHTRDESKILPHVRLGIETE